MNSITTTHQSQINSGFDVKSLTQLIDYQIQSLRRPMQSKLYTQINAFLTEFLNENS